jgi:N4-gp56 family major capsid protein
MANEVLSSTTSTDQEKFLASKLISRSLQKLVAASVCDKVEQKKGAGLTAYFVRYKRMNVPLVPISEGVDPANSSFQLEQVTVTPDQWGDVITITDVAELTTSHPLLQQAQELLSDNAQRVLDREVQIVWLSGTNVQYGDASVTSRRAITTSMKISDSLITRARVGLADGGAPPRGGPSGGQRVTDATGTLNSGQSYLGIAGVQLMGDIMTAGTSLGTWASVAMYANQKALYNAEVGTWLGIRWVETNFIPKYKMLGNTTAAVASGSAFGTDTPLVTAVDGGGTLTSATGYFFKVTRKDKLRGFEEEISIEHSMTSTATGNNESFTFNFAGLTAGYVYNLYFGATTGDANLKLHTANIEVGTTVTVAAVPASTQTPPDNVNPTGTPTVHVVYIHGAESTNWLGLQDLKVYLTDAGRPTTDNPLLLRRKLGYKFMGKAMIRDQTRLLRLELASTY